MPYFIFESYTEREIEEKIKYLGYTKEHIEGLSEETSKFVSPDKRIWINFTSLTVNIEGAPGTNIDFNEPDNYPILEELVDTLDPKDIINVIGEKVFQELIQ